MLNDLHSIIANERVRRGMTLRDVAKIVGVHHTTIHRLEQGCNSTKRQTIEAVMAALGISATYAATASAGQSHKPKAAADGVKR